MKSFEPIYKELEELFIHNLPDYIEKINKIRIIKVRISRKEVADGDFNKSWL